MGLESSKFERWRAQTTRTFNRRWIFEVL